MIFFVLTMESVVSSSFCRVNCGHGREQDCTTITVGRIFIFYRSIAVVILPGKNMVILVSSYDMPLLMGPVG